MYSNAYMNGLSPNYNQQSINERIDNQIAQLNQMKEQFKSNQQPAINQTFQLAPTGTNIIRYANTIDDVNKEIVYGDTPFFSKDMSILWLKNIKGNIKTYELKEIVPLDDKDIKIQFLQAQIEELKGMIKNDANITNVNAEQTSSNTAGNDKSNGDAIKESGPTSIQKISRGKKE